MKIPSIGEFNNANVTGEFVDFSGERYYAIRNVDRMTPFFVSVVSNVDHWLFVSSTGGVTAGRVSPETALFPYVTVDKIHESTTHTGSKTIIRMTADGNENTWEPFKSERSRRYSFTRSIYKNALGNKICFEETNHDLQLTFRYTWMTSDQYGFIRRCEIQNLGDSKHSIDFVDGLQNILPAGTPRFAQTNTSNLIDAYKWTELDEKTGLALYTLYSGITDRAEPSESLRANTVYCMGLDNPQVLISSDQLNAFRIGEPLVHETRRRGVRGAYLVHQTLNLEAGQSQHWQMVADIEKDQAEVIAILEALASPGSVAAEVDRSIGNGSDELARIMAGADAFQAAAQESVVHHHFANVLFNVLRGGTFDDQYNIRSQDFAETVKHFNRAAFERNENMLRKLPTRLAIGDLEAAVARQKDPQLERLRREYLPIFFGRRHGDPSRPWNEFAINVKDDAGDRLLSYQGNWRDIFQNWEALAISYPEYIESIIAKFVNASTMDGYNPYRITKEGIDWEVEEDDNPWSFIGYWGDHQIIYLQKLLEMSRGFHPHRLRQLLREATYSYANVPYRIRPFAELLEDSKNTVTFDHGLAGLIDSRVAEIGADGKLVLDEAGDVYRVNLLEKLLVPLLAKLGNFVLDGGIWLNTQRPEWNDANNALVGQGLSMVTLYYLRRYLRFLQELLAAETDTFELTGDVAKWLSATGSAFAGVGGLLAADPMTPKQRYELFEELGIAACKYRRSIYRNHVTDCKTSQTIAPVQELFANALEAVDHSIEANRRSDGLFNAYNLLRIESEQITSDALYPMLEGQVAALSAGAIAPGEAIAVIDALFDSEVYRPDQQSFMLYPDRKLPSFLEKNCIADTDAADIPILRTMIDNGDERIVVRDARGTLRFNADLANVGELNAVLDELNGVEQYDIAAAREALQALYEDVFNHQEFTGRSGGMFGFEGLGSVYWHMVSKLLLAVQENFFDALESQSDPATVKSLGEQYYRVRDGIGFNKTPAEYGAFPTDPYSHTPKHAGARQPGMTGQVKEEVITRFGELGVRISGGRVSFQPRLLREREFLSAGRMFRYLDVAGNWQELAVPQRGVAFTWCQVPVVYELCDEPDAALSIRRDNGGDTSSSSLSLSESDSQGVFNRTGRIHQIRVRLSTDSLFNA